MGLESLFAAPEVHVGCFRELLAVTWLQKGSPELIRRVGECERVFRLENGGQKVVLLTFVQSASVQKPSALMQVELDANKAAMVAHLKAEAVVITAEGFAASLIRGMVAGVMLLQGPKYPSKIFSAIAPACAWAAPFLADPISSAELEALLAIENRR